MNLHFRLSNAEPVVNKSLTSSHASLLACMEIDHTVLTPTLLFSASVCVCLVVPGAFARCVVLHRLKKLLAFLSLV